MLDFGRGSTSKGDGLLHCEELLRLFDLRKFEPRTEADEGRNKAPCAQPQARRHQSRCSTFWPRGCQQRQATAMKKLVMLLAQA